MEKETCASKIVIVVPLYNEQEVIPKFFRRMDPIISKLGPNIKVLCVDDGSVDRTSELIAKECSERKYVQLLQLSRNFGQQSALRAGLDAANGEAVIFIDADLQDPPELLPSMIEKWEKGADVVIAQRRSRAEKGLRGLCFRIFHKFYARLTNELIPPDSGIFGLISKPVADALRACPETNLYIQGLRGWVGFRQEVVIYDRPDREAGEPKQSFWKLVQYAWNAIASFSTMPLRAILLVGCIISSLSALYAFGLIFVRMMQFFGFFEGQRTPGFTTIAVAIFFLGGIQLVSLGIVGEYLARVYDECKRRPSYIVKQRIP